MEKWPDEPMGTPQEIAADEYFAKNNSEATEKKAPVTEVTDLINPMNEATKGEEIAVEEIDDLLDNAFKKD